MSPSRKRPPRFGENLRSLNSCYTAAIPVIYQDLDVVFSNRETLRAAVSALTEDSRALPSLEYARRLSLICVEQTTIAAKRERSASGMVPWAKELDAPLIATHITRKRTGSQ